MQEHSSPAPLLIFTCGNPSRGDDALGPLLHGMLEAHQRVSGQLRDVDLLTDFQLQIEHSLDLEDRRCVLFVDAGVACSEPFEIRRLRADRDDTFTTHAMSPQALLAVYRQVNHREPPAAYLMTIRASEFSLGGGLSEAAGHNLQQAFEYLVGGAWRPELA